MHDGLNVGADTNDLGVDVDLVMTLVGAGHLLALDVDGDDVVGGHLLEAHAARLHQDAVRILGRAQRHVAHVQ